MADTFGGKFTRCAKVHGPFFSSLCCSDADWLGRQTSITWPDLWSNKMVSYDPQFLNKYATHKQGSLFLIPLTLFLRPMSPFLAVEVSPEMVLRTIERAEAGTNSVV